MRHSSASDPAVMFPCALVDKSHFLNENKSKDIEMSIFMSNLDQKARFSALDLVH